MSQQQTKNSLKAYDNQATLPTFMDHVRELQGRLFSIAIIFLIMACLAYPFFDYIVNFLVAPLGEDHELVYLTPGGAFSFIIKVCMYVGAIGSLPFFIYHLYRFLLPAVKVVNIRRALLYTIISLILAMIGLSFAYFVSLPASLYFLTSFNLHNINPMLTIDSYFSFIMTYMLAGALLFQLPLIITIINTIKPLTPGGMMKYQRQLIVGSFIVAAIISPTPDALNQALLALPVVLMYQFSIMIVWWMNRKLRKNHAIKRTVNPVNSIGNLAVRRAMARPRPVVPMVVSVNSYNPVAPMVASQSRRSTVDGFVRTSPGHQRARNRPIQRPNTVSSHVTSTGTTRGIDGFVIPARQ